MQESDGTALELHHAFVGEVGAWRAGPVDPEFERRWAELVVTSNKLRLARRSDRLDRYVYDQALALFLCAPQALCAVNRYVRFIPYRTTFELAATSVGQRHWSRRR